MAAQLFSAAGLRRLAVAVALPLVLLLAWHIGVRVSGTRLIPLPQDVALMLYDFAFGGLFDDAYSKTLHIHLWKSVTRVYGGFFGAALVAIPLGLLIGRLPLVRSVVDPTLQLLRPVPVK